MDFGNVLVHNFSRWTRWKLRLLIFRCAVRHLRDLKNLILYPDVADAIHDFLVRHTRLIPDAVLGMQRLVQKVGANNVWIVSRVSNGMAENINRAMMLESGIIHETGLSPDHVIFVEQDEQKASVCARLGIDGFIDDSPLVLAAMKDVPCVVFFGPGGQHGRQAFEYITAHGVCGVNVAYEWRHIWNRLNVRD